MARPRKVVTSPGKKGKKDASDEHEEDEGQTDTVEGDGAMSAVNLDKKLKPARSLPEKDVTATTTSTAITAAATAASGDISSRGGAHANGVGKSEESVGPMGSKQSVPRRAVSPDTTSTVGMSSESTLCAQCVEENQRTNVLLCFRSKNSPTPSPYSSSFSPSSLMY